MRRKISNGLNGLGWGYDGSDSSGAGRSEEDGNNGSQQLVSTPKRIGSMGSLATTTTAERSLAAAGTGSGNGRHPGRSNGGGLEVQPLLLGSLDLTLRNLGVGLGEGLGGVGLGGVSSAAAAAGGGGRSSRRASMQYQSW